MAQTNYSETRSSGLARVTGDPVLRRLRLRADEVAAARCIACDLLDCEVELRCGWEFIQEFPPQLFAEIALFGGDFFSVTGEVETVTE